MMRLPRIHRLTAPAAAIAFALICSLCAIAQSGRIAFTSDRTGSWQIYTMNADGSDQLQLTNLAPTDDDGLFPSTSPDGKQIAFNYNAGDGADLYVVNGDGTGLRQLTTDHASLWPRWSPDGKRLVFATVGRTGLGVIATMPADGSGQRTILTTDHWESVGAVYTPDGKQIVFGSQMGGFVTATWIMNADGSRQRRLTPAALRGQPWSVSPDGKHILGYSNQDSPAALGNSLFVMNLDGSGRKRLAPLSRFHHDLYGSYSPDGTKIAFVSDRISNDMDDFTYGTFDVLTMNADGTNISNVAPTAGFCPFDGNCVTPLWGPSPKDSGAAVDKTSDPAWELENSLTGSVVGSSASSKSNSEAQVGANSCPAVRCSQNHTQGRICGIRLCSIPGVVMPILGAFDRTNNRACFYGC